MTAKDESFRSLSASSGEPPSTLVAGNVPEIPRQRANIFFFIWAFHSRKRRRESGEYRKIDVNRGSFLLFFLYKIFFTKCRCVFQENLHSSIGWVNTAIFEHWRKSIDETNNGRFCIYEKFEAAKMHNMQKNEIKYHGIVLVIFHRRNKSLVRVCFFSGSHKYMKSQQFSQSLIYESLFETYLKPIPSLQSEIKYSKLRFQTTVNFQSKNTQHNFHLYVRMLDIRTFTLHNCLTSAKMKFRIINYIVTRPRLPKYPKSSSFIFQNYFIWKLEKINSSVIIDSLVGILFQRLPETHEKS